MSSLVRSSAHSESKDSSWPPRSLIPVGILGGTGLVGRMLARSLCEHPFLCCGPIVGSSRSAGQLFQNVWLEKETALETHYGTELWKGDRQFPSALIDTKVVDIDGLIELGCRVVISAVAPRLGFLEDKLTEAGITVISISPYKRQEGALCVLEANFNELHSRLTTSLNEHFTKTNGKLVITPSNTLNTLNMGEEAASQPSMLPLVKSPNCVCCGTSTVLSGLFSIFGPMENVSVTTFQSLSGRGDSKYPSELVVGNVYPLRSTKEPTESLICEELAHVLGKKLINGRNSLSVAAYRVSVQRGHLIDLRIRFSNLEQRKKFIECGDDVEKKKILMEEIYMQLEQWTPLLDSVSGNVDVLKEHLPSVPVHPIMCSREEGAPRPKSHHLCKETEHTNGYQVTVGNVGINDGPYDLVLTLVVDNLVKGALGAALQLLEYTLMVTKARE